MFDVPGIYVRICDGFLTDSTTAQLFKTQSVSDVRYKQCAVMEFLVAEK
jgi:hypothetical protein